MPCSYSRSLVYLIVLFAVFTCVAGAFAQSPRPQVQAQRLADWESRVLDGSPDEPAWRRATPATDFLQRDPDNGAPATEKTEVRVIFDRDRIVLGVICHDSEPTELL